MPFLNRWTDAPVSSEEGGGSDCAFVSYGREEIRSDCWPGQARRRMDSSETEAVAAGMGQGRSTIRASEARDAHATSVLLAAHAPP